MKISKLYTRLFSAAAVLLGAVTVAQTQDSNCDDECRSQVAQARAATAKYHEVGNALADGFRAAEACVQAPTGAMGFHFVNPPRVQSPSVNAGEPGVLLYLPDEAGEMRLVAVEYFAPVIVTGVGPCLAQEHRPPDSTIRPRSCLGDHSTVRCPATNPECRGIMTSTLGYGGITQPGCSPRLTRPLAVRDLANHRSAVGNQFQIRRRKK